MNEAKATEIEVKFFLPDLPALRKRVLQRGGNTRRQRMFERNLRFDTPAADLSAAGAVLRLREDNAVTLTYKQRLQDGEHRREIEFAVGDAGQARAFLEALGYNVFFIYEKYREVMTLGACALMLDDLPFGSFLEIEGPDMAAIERCAAALKLNMEHRLRASYMQTFLALKQQFQFDADYATFESFQHSKPAQRAAWRSWLGALESEEPS